MTTTRALTTVATLCALAATARADAKSEAKDHVAKASAAHKDKRYAEALDELLVAYTLDPKPELLYGIAQTYVKLGKCPDAITYYQRFLDSKPGADAADLAKQAIETCKTNPPPAEVEPAPPAPPVTPPPPPAVVVVQPPPPPPESPAWYRDTLGDGLVGGGAVAVIAGLLCYHAAASDLDERGRTYGDQQSLADRAGTLRVAAIVLGVGGAVAIGGGVAHYLTRPDEGPAVSVSAHGGATATWTWRF